MSRDEIDHSLYHDLRGALSLVRMSIELLEMLETSEARGAPEKRLVAIERAKLALARAVKVADQLSVNQSESGPAHH